MREAADCLHWMVTVLTEDKDFEQKEVKKDVDPSLLQLVAIDQAGFIEAFAPLNRADNEIAQDLRHLPHRQLRQDLPLLRRVRGPESATTGRIPVTTSFPASSQSTQFLYQACQNYPAETLPAIFPPGVQVQCR